MEARAAEHGALRLQHRLAPQMSGVDISTISLEATWSQPHVSRPQWAKQTNFLTTEPENSAQNKALHS